MLSAVATLFESKQDESSRERMRVTPGRLYHLLTAEFLGERGPCTCDMPMLFLRGDASGAGSNWGLHRGTSVCSACSAVIDRMIERYSRRYELTDPYGWSPDDLRIE